MATSVKNTLSSIRVLEDALDDFENTHGPPPKSLPDMAFHLRILLNSVRKCVAGLARQIRFYESAKSPTRALIVEHPDGSAEYVSGQTVVTLCLHLPSQSQDVVVFGKPEALASLASELATSGMQITGPLPALEHAQLLGRNAEKPEASE